MRVLESYPHDSSSYTQGLLVDGAFPVDQRGPVLLESAGRYGKSRVFRYRLGSTRNLSETRLPPTVFGEGMAEFRNELFVLTWREGQGFVLDAQGLTRKRTWAYRGEGWGLTTLSTGDKTYLVQSDGSQELKFLDPSDLKVVRTLWVQRGSRPQTLLNELEWMGETLFANVYGSDEIVGIDPSSGCVVKVVDARIKDPRKNSENVLNGIAFDPRSKAIYLTGKLWTRVHRVEFSPAALPPSSGNSTKQKEFVDFGEKPR